MAQSTVEEPILDVEETLTKWEKNIEENKKIYSIIAGAIILVVGGYFAWTKLYIAPQEMEAESQMFQAEKYFKMDSLNKAMFGDGNHSGFNDIIENFSLTPSGNLANYYMGICYLKKGEYENAITFLEDFESDDEMLGSIAIGAIGDAYSELGDLKSASEYYLKASKKKSNKFTTPIYLMRASNTYFDLGQYKDAIKIYQQIKENYAESPEGREIDKYIARAKAMNGE